MSEAPFLYHLLQPGNFILTFSSFFSACHHVQKESILTSYQKQTVGINIAMWLKYHDAISINGFIKWKLKPISELCCFILKKFRVFKQWFYTLSFEKEINLHHHGRCFYCLMNKYSTRIRGGSRGGLGGLVPP